MDDPEYFPQTSFGDPLLGGSYATGPVDLKQLKNAAGIGDEEQQLIQWQLPSQKGDLPRAIAYLGLETDEQVIVGTQKENHFTVERVYTFENGHMNYDGHDLRGKGITIELNKEGAVKKESFEKAQEQIRKFVTFSKENEQNHSAPPLFEGRPSNKRLEDEKWYVSEPEKTRTDSAYNQLMTDLLQKHDGVFIGEHHNKAAVVEATTKLLRQHRAQGVTSISYELPQNMMDELSNATSLEEAQKKFPRFEPKQMTALYHLCQECKKYDIKILGHESPTISQIITIQEGAPDPDDYGKIKHILAYGMSSQGMTNRDAWAAEYIKHNKPEGKIIVIGGAGHSKTLKQKNSDTPGLNGRLGIPSVDISPVYSGKKLEEVGHTYRAESTGADYLVALPESINRTFDNMKITSWPPPREELERAIPDDSRTPGEFVPPPRPTPSPPIVPGRNSPKGADR